MTPITIDKYTVSADGVDVITLSNIPSAGMALVYLDTGTSKDLVQSVSPIDDGTLEVSFDTPGLYWVTAKGREELDGVVYEYTLEAMIDAS